jgi:hypothetical protein
MANRSCTTQNTQNLQADTTFIALALLNKQLVELERQIGLECNSAQSLILAIEHRELLDLYQSEIKRSQDYNPYSTPWDW